MQTAVQTQITPVEVYLQLGSNLGDRLENLEKAQKLLVERVGTLLQASDIYETEPWGVNYEHAFLNQVLVLETVLQPMELLQTIWDIEAATGRVRGMDIPRYAPRTLDIDILLYSDVVIALPELTVPHAEIANRRFVLCPLSEIAPEGVHPVLKKTWCELLAVCADTKGVARYRFKEGVHSA